MIIHEPEKQQSQHVTSFITPVSTPSGLHLPATEMKIEDVYSHTFPSSDSIIKSTNYYFRFKITHTIVVLYVQAHN